MSTRIAKALLSKGMFPRDLPPLFVTADLGKKYVALAAQIKKSKRTKPDRYSLPKAKLGRRIAYVVNPVPYFLLSGCLATNWKAIKAHLGTSKIAAHTPGFFGRERALKEINFTRIRERKIVDGSGHAFVLTTDYARFFPTIYTHSISWALHTKAVAKANTKNLALLGNVLDLHVMQLQEGQTAGIPVGPDASYILAEIVATAIDSEYIKLSKIPPFGLRYVDDFTLFFSSRAEAERALSCLSQAAAEYQIELNPQKTSITALADEAEEAWVFALAAFPISTREWGQRNSLAKLTELCISLFAKHDDGSIGKYAIKKISSSVISPKHIDFAVACVLRLCAISASAYPDAVAFVMSYLRAGYPINTAPIKRFIENTVLTGASLGYDLEVCWALWLALEARVKLSMEVVVELEKSQSSIVVILAKLLAERKLLRAKFVPALAAASPTADAFDRERWLLYYEGCRRKWFGWNDVQLKASSLAVLHANNVSFLDLSAQTKSVLEVRHGVGPITPQMIAASTLRRLQDLLVSRPVDSSYGMGAPRDVDEEEAQEDEEDEELLDAFMRRMARND